MFIGKVVASFCAAALLLAPSDSEGADHGMDEKVLSQIPKDLQAIVDSGQSSGVVALVARNGKIASIDAVGWRVIDKEPMEATDVFRCASMSKPFVAASIMMLVDEGKLKLDDLVEDHIPEFKWQKVDTINRYQVRFRGSRSSDGLPTAQHPLTIRTLLNHTDGLPVTRSTKAAKTIKERALASAKNPLMWEPGSKCLYGGEGLHVAAWLVEKYSGLPYTEFLQTRILDPLGMKSTWFTYKDIPEGRRLPGHRKRKNKWEPFFKGDPKIGGSGHYFAVDAGLYSTAGDMFLWHQMLLNGGEYGGVRLLSKNSVREMTSNQTGDAKLDEKMKNFVWGLTWKVVHTPEGNTAMLSKGSFGKGGAGNTIWADPDTKTLYIVMQNISGGDHTLAIDTVLKTASAAIVTKASASNPEEGTPIPGRAVEFRTNYCIDCHDAASMKGDLNLDLTSIDWSQKESRALWAKVLKANEEGLMPPPKKDQPTGEEREKIIAWLDSSLVEHTPIGGTLPRRLNQAEYQATIRKLLHFPEFKLPMGFPSDTEYHGFNNVGEGLVLSPPHLEAYASVAQEIADQIFPPAKSAPKPRSWKAGPEDMVLSFSAAGVHGDALRLASRSVDIMRSCTWPSRIEISDSGTYRLSVDASKFLSDEGRPFKEAMILEVYARAVTATDRSKIQDFRLLKEIKVSSEKSRTTTFEADLYEGETVLFRWKNAEMTHDPPDTAEAFEILAEENPRFLAAWLKTVFPKGDPKRPIRIANLRGRNGWDTVSKHMADPNLDLTHASGDSALAQAFFKLAASKGKTTIADCLCYFYHTKGPAMEMHQLSIEGPSKLVESPADLKQRERQLKITGTPHEGQSKEAFLRDFLAGFLPRAFRKAVTDETVETYLTIAKRHWDAGHTYEEGMHLLFRNILISPRFLYRCLGAGELDDFDLATRLSYFLTQGPPDETLIDLARRGRLSATRPSKADPAKMEYWVLRREAERLMPTEYTDPMIQSFVGQWLDTDSLHGIMPDPKFKFDETSIDIAKYETERFFTEILTKNLPMTDFIDPDFTFSSIAFVQRNYGFTPKTTSDKNGKTSSASKRKLQRLKIERGGRHGGLLGQSAILTATANGVDTQPVIRGVWVLENILGIPTPKPPKNVPALTPDTRGTTTPREMLTAHTNEASCATCHQRIDPVGFALENYDPVGRWRTEWPGTNTRIDASGILPDGTRIENAIELKSWMVDNIDLFSECVSEKLMIYATGRIPNYTEKREIEVIVRQNRESGNGFRNLVFSLIESETFRSK